MTCLLSRQAVEEAKAAKKDKWVKDHLGQMLITAGQINWASECEKALGDPVGSRTALSSLRKRWDALLARLIVLTRSSLSEVERKKASSLLHSCHSSPPVPFFAGLLDAHTIIWRRMHQQRAGGGADHN